MSNEIKINGMPLAHWRSVTNGGFGAWKREFAEALDVIEKLQLENVCLRAEIDLDNQIIADRNEVLTALECDVHGLCVPGALEKIAKMKAENTRMRFALEAINSDARKTWEFVAELSADALSPPSERDE